mmetsp:Transcript_130546/g.226028  ORF Transcript_130546/g.226028 Transcript_130546/m.226028 type:complete len:434 (-) Transcript_130546:53-1354(-)
MKSLIFFSVCSFLVPWTFVQSETCNDLHCHSHQVDLLDEGVDGSVSYLQRQVKDVRRSVRPTHKFQLSPVVNLLGEDIIDYSKAGLQGVALKLFYYIASLGTCSAIIAFIYWPHGPTVILKIVAYLLLGSTVTISVKLVFQDDFRFNFPKLLTTFHLIVSSIVGFLILFYRKYEQSKAIEIPTVSEFVWKLLPLCLGFTYSLGTGNMSLLYCSVGFAAIIGASTPFFSIALMSLLGMPFNWSLLLPVSGIVFGCMATVMGTVEFSRYGLVLVLLSNAGRAIKAVMQQKIMTGEVKEKYDPVTLLAWQCLICSPLMLSWSALSEGAPAFTALMQQTQPGVFFAVVALSCAIAAALNAIHIFVIRDLGAIGVQATAQLKQGLVTLGGVLLLGDRFSLLSVVGGSLVLMSAFWYSRMEAKAKSDKPPNAKGSSGPA